MGRVGLVVVDAQRAFTDPAGSIGRIHPPDQFTVIRDTVERLASFAAAHRGPKVWVGSRYAPGQFTAGRMDRPLSRLCADPSSVDCEWEPRLVPPPDALVVTKADMDAGSCPAFVEATDEMVGAVEEILVTGFWLSACVAATATSCAQRLGDRVPVVIPLPLAATRVGLYDPEDDHLDEVDVTQQLDRLRAAGVVIRAEAG
jgi:nicotinamidase-related amidase